MSVASLHPDYQKASEHWRQSRDVIAGESEVKGAGELYLDRLPQQTDEEFLAYKARASFFNAVARTLDGLTGQVFRKDPVATFPEGDQALAKLEEDADLSGQALYDYARAVIDETISVGRCGTLVDWSEQEVRPFFSLYRAESIINWRKSRIGGKSVLSLVVLEETVSDNAADGLPVAVGTSATQLESSADPYGNPTKKQLRVLRLVKGAVADDRASEAQGMVREVWLYQMEIWEEVEREAGKKGGRRTKQVDFVLQSITQPTRRGRPLEFIPFVFHGPTNNGTQEEIEKPPLEDLVSLNLEHYRLSADYKHGMHFTALPTAWVAGFGKEAVLRIGSQVAWVSENADAKAGYLEFTGAGLGSIAAHLDKLEKLMAVMGARLLEIQKKEAETAEAMGIRQAGEAAVLQTITNAATQSVTLALKLAYWWGTLRLNDLADVKGEDVNFAFNSDFVSAKMTADEVVKMVEAWQARGISQKTLHWNLSQGEILPPGTDPKDEAAMIAQESAAFAGLFPEQQGEDQSGGDQDQE